MRFRETLGLFGALFMSWIATAQAAPHPELDITATRSSSPTARVHLDRMRNDVTLQRLGIVAGTDPRYGVPTFVWAIRSGTTVGSSAGPGAARSAAAHATPEQAARDHVARIAPLFRLEAGDARGVSLRYVHDTGQGGIIAAFKQTVGGIEVFRDEMKVLMDRNLDLVAVSGYVPSSSLRAGAAPPAFQLGSAQAIDAAVRDFSDGTANAASARRLGSAPGGFERFQVPAARLQPVRIKKVLFHLADDLEPAYYLELIDDTDAYSYVVSAGDGSVLFRHYLTASDSYSYRVWAGAAAPRIPADGPQGNAPTPHPTGNPDFYNPPFVASSLVSLQNGPISTNDPWLPPGATQTLGNNVDAYADLAAPDGFSAGDLRATTTGPSTFDRTYDPTLDAAASGNQQMAAITQLFYDDNFFHDWYYDAGFNEASGNAQSSNYGRGGVAGDRLLAEAQDYSGNNNANMSTPSDGGSPRMQMYVFLAPGLAKVTIGATDYAAGTAPGFGPQTFSVTAEVVLVNDGSGTTSDGCQSIVNAVAGKIALIDRGTCAFVLKAQNAQAAGAVGVIIADNVAASSPPALGGTGAVSIPVLSVTQATGNTIKTALSSGTVTATLTRQSEPTRDGTIDNQIVAHEWGHYISNRLIGDANGLTTQQSGGMGEGWGDFHAMLMTVQPEDATVPSNPNFSGVYGLAGYAAGSSIGASNSYYFGVRRYPYSTDLNKNPLTFRHIQDGVPLPVGPPVRFGADGSSNSEVHNTGEVWTTMLWECYAAMLRDTGRLTFNQARDRMRNYLVAAYKMTPLAPTFTEARDAVLAVAYANDPIDFNAFCQAFARRGAGTGAVSPDRFSLNNAGVVESFACGGDLALYAAEVHDDVASCDHDGYVDNGETGRLIVTLRNSGATTLSNTTLSVSSTNPKVSFPHGNSLSLPASQPFGTTGATIAFKVSGASGVQALDFQIQYNDPGLLVAGPRNAAFSIYGNADEAASNLETVETLNPPWSFTGMPAGPIDAWRRQGISSTDHRFHGPDPGDLSDQYLISPPLHVAPTGNFTLQFSHAYSFERDDVNVYDGGVIELSTDGGGSWNDIGAAATPTYNGTLFTGSGNVLSGRLAYVGANAAYPSLEPVSMNLGTSYAGQTVRIRFRLGSDVNTGAPGWDIDNITVTNLTSPPFFTLVPETSPCTATAVEEELPRELSLAIVGPNPMHDRGRFRFALPRAAHVELGIYDISGRRVATVASGDYSAGNHAADWFAATGARPATGVYFARMMAGSQSIVRRVIVVE